MPQHSLPESTFGEVMNLHFPPGFLKRKRRIKKRRLKRQLKKSKQIFKVTKSNYYQYLKSDQWSKIRTCFFSSNSDHRICFICGSKKNLQAHHKTYERAGKERMADLVCLCQDCHNATHKFLKLSKHDKDIGLWNAADKLKILIEGKNSLDVFSRFYY